MKRHIKGFKDSNGIYHYTQDCSSISGKYKIITKGVMYPLCKLCQKAHDNYVHATALDMNENMGKYVKEFAENVSKADIPEDDKKRILLQGLIGMKSMQAIYNIIDIRE